MYTTLQDYIIKISSMEFREEQLQYTENHTFDSDLRLLKSYMLTAMCYLTQTVRIEQSTAPLICMTDLQFLPIYQAKSVLVLKQLRHFLVIVDRVWESTWNILVFLVCLWSTVVFFNTVHSILFIAIFYKFVIYCFLVRFIHILFYLINYS